MHHINGPGSRPAAAGCVLAAAALLQASLSPAQPQCDALCQVNTLGWRVIDPGPPLWLESGKGSPRIELAVAEMGTPGATPVYWAKSQLAGPLGAFGALGACKGSFPAAPEKVSVLECSVPPGRDGPRHGALLAVATAAGLQVIGAVAPLGVNLNPLSSSALIRLAGEEREALTPAGAVRAAIATLSGAAYYAAPGAGAGGPAVEGVYHYWHYWNGPAATGGAAAAMISDRGADVVLFRNGEAWRNPGAGPGDIDPIKFQEARWLDLGHWQRQDGGIAITFHGQDTMLIPEGPEGKFQRYEPAARQRVEGLWQWSPADSSGAALRLHADGRFELQGSSPALELTGGAGRDTVPNRSIVRGRYRIDGYTLDLTYDDGRQASALFYWAGDLNHDRYGLCIINGTQWLGGRAL